MLQVWLQGETAKKVYGEKQIIPYSVEFEEFYDDSEEESTSTSENDTSEVTGESLVVTEERIGDESHYDQQTMLKED